MPSLKQSGKRLAGRVWIISCALAFALTSLSSVAAWGQPPQVLSRPLGNHNTPKLVSTGSAKLVQAYDPASKLRLAISIKAPKMAEEEVFLKQLQDKSSPNFHKYLTPAQWNARFAPAAQDEQAVVDWATSRGLTITARYPNRMMVNVEGTVDAIQKAFNININRYEVNGTVEFSNDRDPEIPTNLEGIVEFVDGLNSIDRMLPAHSGLKGMRGPDYTPGPLRQMGSPMHGDSKAPAPKDLAKAGQLKGIGGQITNGFYDPTDIYSQEAYDYNALQALGHCCNPYHTSGHDGGGPVETSIGLATDGDFLDSDWAGFHDQYPYLAWFYYHISVGGTAGCCSDESTLDLEWSIATSNSFGAGSDTAQVYNYEAANGFGDFGTVFQQMLNDNLVRVVNISYGLPEQVFLADEPGLLTSWHSLFNQMIGQGWTIMAASGDGGSDAGCTGALAVLYPESDPDVTSVGGTNLQLNGDGSFFNEVAWTGGTSPGSCSSNGGGGGGGCSVVWAAPGYQTIGGNPYCGSGSRSVPDVALNASQFSGQNYYFDGSLSGVAGTSIASPMMSGFIAQEDAYSLSMGNACGGGTPFNCAPIGEVDYDIYAEGGYNESAPHYPFYDITEGCTSNDTIGVPPAWCAGPGYDLATGWGSFNALQLAWAINWEDNFAYSAPSINYSGPATNTWYNTDQIVTWSVNANSNPTGIAGFTQGWDSIPTDFFFDGNRNDSNSFFSGPEYPNATNGCLDLTGASCAGSVSQGCHTVHVQAWSNQGSPSGDTTYGPLCYDDVAPIVTAANSPAANTYGYNNTSVKITLTATDPGGSGASGIKATYYAIDSFACTQSTLGSCASYSGPITIAATGTHFIVFLTEDVAGNFNAGSFDEVFIDEVPPVTSATLSGSLVGSIYESAVKVSLSATDNYSGVLVTKYSLDGGATATYSSPLSISTLGSHTVKFFSEDYAGNTESTKSVSFTISSPTTTTLVSTPNPGDTGAATFLTATVAATIPGVTPTGNVTFTWGPNNLGTIALVGGVAKTSTTILTLGDHTLTATYAGATNILPSVGTTTENIEQRTTTTLAISPNPGVDGSPITFTATTVAGNGGIPGGTVEFFHGSTLIGTAPLLSGKATLTSSTALTYGDYSVTATYEGDSNYHPSYSSPVVEPVMATTTTTVTSSKNPSTLGSSVVFTATVHAFSGPTAVGTVTFRHGSTVMGTVSLNSSGVANLTYTLPNTGTFSITAEYNGATLDKASVSPIFSQTVNQ